MLNAEAVEKRSAIEAPKRVCRCTVDHPTIGCVDCGRDITHYVWSAFDGEKRCGNCHVKKADELRRTLKGVK